MRGTIPVSRAYIVSTVRRIDSIPYKTRVGGGLEPEIQRLRNKGLVSFLYLSARRVSEFTGRILRDSNGNVIDHWRGLYHSDIRYDKFRGRDTMITSFRILKKGTIKFGIRDQRGEVALSLDDEPFIRCIQNWLEYSEPMGGRVFQLTPYGIYQIIQRIDPKIVGPHWFRHMRLSHLAETLNPYQLNERIGHWESLDPALSYVHGRLEDYFDAVDQARLKG